MSVGRDTALLVGAHLQLDASVSSADYRPLDLPVTFSTASPEIELTDDGLVTAVAHGTAKVTASVGELTDTVIIAVVPAGRLLRVIQTSLEMLSTDGSGLERIAAIGAQQNVAWFDEERVVHSWGYGLGITTLEGETTALILPLEPEVRYASNPQPTADGEWIYFDAQVPVAGRTFGREIWRIRPDGMDAQRIGPPATLYEESVYPSPSPDGRRVVYVNELAAGGPSLFVLDVATGAIDTLGVRGSRPQWSPAGDRILFRSDASRPVTMRPDGSERTVLIDEYTYAPIWSPDAAWVLTDGDYIHLESGTIARGGGRGVDWAWPLEP